MNALLKMLHGYFIRVPFLSRYAYDHNCLCKCILSTSNLQTQWNILDFVLSSLSLSLSNTQSVWLLCTLTLTLWLSISLLSISLTFNLYNPQYHFLSIVLTLYLSLLFFLKIPKPCKKPSGLKEQLLSIPQNAKMPERGNVEMQKY